LPLQIARSNNCQTTPQLLQPIPNNNKYKHYTMFEKTLTDLVTGIRSHKRDTALFISQNIAEIKNELQSSDLYTKSNALQKLTFLQSMGYSMSWAAFSAVEVMSSPRFALKRVGYLAATQVSFTLCSYHVFILRY